MKPTNYHLFDFLDFDPDLSRDESLWKAYKPTSVPGGIFHYCAPPFISLCSSPISS